jgi:hypothetical protein
MMRLNWSLVNLLTRGHNGRFMMDKQILPLTRWNRLKSIEHKLFMWLTSNTLHPRWNDVYAKWTQVDARLMSSLGVSYYV